jgi:energy-coupling factor transport system ATP-binding protein
MDTCDDNRIWDIRQKAGMVFQNPENQIIGQIVEEDVGFGPENMGVPTEEIWERVNESLKTVGMYEYRKASPNHLSGGQKQRVSIARALLRNAPILVLEDSTSALDVGTEKRLLRDIKTYYPDKTVLISAHRLTSVVDCDEIIYLKDGEIIERGSFEELMALNGTFAKIYNIQVTQEGSVNFDALADKLAEGRA